MFSLYRALTFLSDGKKQRLEPRYEDTWLNRFRSPPPLPLCAMLSAITLFCSPRHTIEVWTTTCTGLPARFVHRSGLDDVSKQSLLSGWLSVAKKGTLPNVSCRPFDGTTLNMDLTDYRICGNKMDVVAFDNNVSKSGMSKDRYGSKT